MDFLTSTQFNTLAVLTAIAVAVVVLSAFGTIMLVLLMVDRHQRHRVTSALDVGWTWVVWSLVAVLLRDEYIRVFGHRPTLPGTLIWLNFAASVAVTAYLYLRIRIAAYYKAV